MKLKHTLLPLVCLGVSVTPLVAQQPAPEAGDSRSQRENSGERDGRKTVAYLGVLTREVPPEVRAQFSLPAGFGLMVDEVLAESPARAAGLKAYDVLLKFDDQQLVNMEQLMALVRARKKGDTASLTIITGGKETQVQVTLAERVAPEVLDRQRRAPHNGPQGHHQHGGRDVPDARDLNKDYREQLERHAREMRGHQERIEKWQKEMREYQERLQDWTRGNRDTPMPKPPAFEKPAPGERGRMNPDHGPKGDMGRSQHTESHASATVTRRDEAGEYTIRKNDDRATFSVRDKDGKEQSWPINNEDERKAVPEPYQDKLREMEKGVRIERNRRPPGSEDPRPMPPVEPKPQGKPTSA